MRLRQRRRERQPATIKFFTIFIPNYLTHQTKGLRRGDAKMLGNGGEEYGSKVLSASLSGTHHGFP